MQTECGLFGCIMKTPLNNKIIYDALKHIQHRGQDSYGYVTMTENANCCVDVKLIKHFGLLSEYEQFYCDNNIQLFLGHMRYSTNTGLENSLNKNNIQPIEISQNNYIYLAHNGNLPNLKQNMLKLGLKYREGMSDTHLFKLLWEKMYNEICPNNIINVNKQLVIDYIKYIINNIPGAYSCVITYYQKSTGNNSREGNYFLFGFKDRFGYKPLSICKINSNDGNTNYCFVSETVQILETNIMNNNNSQNFISDVKPGEICCIEDSRKPEIIYSMDNGNGNVFLCALEPIYFMKNDNLLFNGIVNVADFRKQIGIELAKQDLEMLATQNNKTIYVPDDYKLLQKRDILYIPESSFSISLGYSDFLSSKVRQDLIFKIENIRSFIESTHEARIGKIKRKFSFNIEDIKKLTEITLIDDSIVRGNSMKFIVDTLYSINKNLKIHIRIGCPKLVKECNFGIDLYDDELISKKMINLVEYFHVESIMFLEIKRLQNIFNSYGIINCGMCFGNIHENNKTTLEW